MNRRERSFSTFVRPCPTLIAAAWLCAGCGSAVGGEPYSRGQQSQGTEAQAAQTAPTSVLDEEVLQAALGEQASIEAHGATLRGRVWLHPDAYVASYKTTNGGTVATQVVGKDSLLHGLPTVQKGESLKEFASRTGLRASLPVANMAADRLLFAPAENAAGEYLRPTKTESTLADVAAALAACNDRAINHTCSQPIGYWDTGYNLPSDMIPPWNRTGRGGATFSATGSAGYAAVCAQGGGANFLWYADNAQSVLSQTSVVITVPPLAFASITIGDGWDQNDCGWLNASCYVYDQFRDLTHHFHVSQNSNGPIETFCGHITDQAIIQYNDVCDPLFTGNNCPQFLFPGDVPINSSDQFFFEY